MTMGELAVLDSEEDADQPMDETEDEGSTFDGVHDDDDDDDDDDEDDDDDSDEGSFDSEDEQELAALESMHAEAEQGKARVVEAAQKEWRDMLEGLKTRKTTVLKITDPTMIGVIFQPSSNDNIDVVVETLLDALLDATNRSQHGRHAVVTHVNLSKCFLQRFNLSQQTRLFATLFQQHATTLAYVRLVADETATSNTGGATKVLDYTPNSILHTAAWLTPLSFNNNNKSMNAAPATILTEMEIRTLDITSPATVQQLVSVLESNRESLRQVNWLGIHLDSENYQTLNSTKGLLDPIVDFITNNMPQLDELRLQVLLLPNNDNVNGNAAPRADLVTHGALERLLQAKPKWWRLGLDGVGLDDGHAVVLQKAFASSDNCRAGDLLSLTDNPRLSSQAMRKLFIDVFYNKTRMGLIQVDQQHAYWERQFDLVRPLNNVHGRLDAIRHGAYSDPTKWMEWLHKLSHLKWLDDAHKINYIWFALLEKPEMIKLHSNNDDKNSGSSSDEMETTQS